VSLDVNTYFAYGSNLSPAQMKKGCPGSRLLGVGKVAGYRLAFTRRSTGWGGGVADLLPGEGDVWGALYSVTATDLERLDAYEGVPDAYQREVLQVARLGADAVDAWVYFVTTKMPDLLPSHAYWAAIVDGAVEVGLPADYVSALNTIKHHPRT
jgi:gamma-glutamylcyclotransferase (GGCT)/AIG2-like uncharacterized protein YtfP